VPAVRGEGGIGGGCLTEGAAHRGRVLVI